MTSRYLAITDRPFGIFQERTRPRRSVTRRWLSLITRFFGVAAVFYAIALVALSVQAGIIRF
jgi:hypothetical protein